MSHSQLLSCALALLVLSSPSFARHHNSNIQYDDYNYEQYLYDPNSSTAQENFCPNGPHRPHPNCPDYNQRPQYPSYPHHPRPPHYPEQNHNPAFNGSIRACVAFEQADTTYSPDMPLTVSILDGLVLAEHYRIYLQGDLNELYVVFNHPNSRTPVILPLKHRKNLSTAATVLNDLQGNSWRISRTWKRCMR